MASIHSLNETKPVTYFSIIIVGMKYHNIETKDVLELKSFFLKPEPKNKYDSKAVQVFGYIKGGSELKIVGYISNNELHKLPNIDEKGEFFEARVVYRETANAIYSLLYTN